MVGVIRVVVVVGLFLGAEGVGGLAGKKEDIFFNFQKLQSFFVFIDTLIIIQLASCLIGLGSILMHAIDS